MKPPLNILDHLADCAEVCDGDFPGAITREHVDGAHGRSSTTALTIAMDDGETVRVTFERLPKEAA